MQSKKRKKLRKTKKTITTKKTTMKTNTTTKSEDQDNKDEDIKIEGKRQRDDEDKGNKLVDNHNTFRSKRPLQGF